MFHSITKSLLDELRKKSIKATDIGDHIAILPLSLMQESYTTTSLVADELEDKRTLTGLLHFLNGCVWNFIDYHLLEYVIAEFGSEHLKQRMKQYVMDLERFESHTTVYEFIEHWPGRQLKPPNFDELTVKINKDPYSCTLKELNDFRQSLCVEFWPRLSEYAQFIMYHYKHSEGCFIVTWILPSDLALELEKLAKRPSSHEFFMQNQILSFTVCGKAFYVMATLGSKYNLIPLVLKTDFLIII